MSHSPRVGNIRGQALWFSILLVQKDMQRGILLKREGIIYDHSVWVDKMENGDLYVLSYVYMRYNIHMAGGMRLKLQT